MNILNYAGSKSKKEENFEISDIARDIIELLLKKDPDDRIFPNEILKHSFFKYLDIDSIKYKKIESPLKILIFNNKDKIDQYVNTKNDNIDFNKHKKRKKTHTELDQGNFY